jgi:site-specific DNA recombinase
MKQAVIYARVSTKEQEKEGYSIPAQLALLQDYAQRNNITVMQTYTEAETAKKAGRVAFTQMKDYLKATPEVTCILVEKTDRLYRNFKDYVLLEDLDVEVHLVKEGEVLSKESASSVKFIHGIKVLMAKNYIDNLSEEVKKGMYEKARQGHFPFQPPYGYRNNRQTRMIDVCPERSVFVERAFELYATGQYSLQEVSHQLVAEGFRYRPYQAKIAKSSLEVMLKNIFYTGDFMIKDQFFNGKHQALVSPALFEKVNSILTRGTFSKPVKHDFAFAGMMTCGHCGCAITGQMKLRKKGKVILG